MNLKQFHFIIDNLVVSDWIKNENDAPIIYKQDFNLSFHIEHLDIDFDEDWATGHPDENATKSIGCFYYGNNPIYTIHFAKINGGRAILPYPKSIQDLVITKREYNVASLFNDRLDDYLKRSGISVK